jgi:hypothetical protein
VQDPRLTRLYFERAQIPVLHRASLRRALSPAWSATETLWGTGPAVPCSAVLDLPGRGGRVAVRR